MSKEQNKFGHLIDEATKTPRTDNAAYVANFGGDVVVDAYFARQLEIELADAKAKLRKLRKKINEKKKMKNFRLSDNTIGKIEELCRLHGISQTETVARAIDMLYDAHKRLNAMNEFTDALKEEQSAPEPALIFAACNASLRCSAECPRKLHQQSDCETCGNESCVQAWQKLQDVYKSCDYFK